MNVKKRISRQVLILDSLSAVLVLVATLYYTTNKGLRQNPEIKNLK